MTAVYLQTLAEEIENQKKALIFLKKVNALYLILLLNVIKDNYESIPLIRD